MLKIQACHDPEKCRAIWERLWPRQCLFDLWPVRDCFRMHYAHPPAFLIAEENGAASGLLALSWIEERQYYGNFPGELWQGRTWLEQNRIPAANPGIAAALLDSVPGATRLRYLAPEALPPGRPDAGVDETGYLFMPAQYGYSFARFMETFSARTRKKFAHEFAPFDAMGVAYRYNQFADIEVLFEINRQRFGELSYFHDRRFLNSFEALAGWLAEQGMLRITTVLIGGAIAAVDVGAAWNGTYTVLAGGALREFPGVAKLINFHHIEWACRERLRLVDFLCGDFGWKAFFRLTPRPLYQWANAPVAPALPAPVISAPAAISSPRPVVLVVGTTTDYVDWLRQAAPGNALYLTDPQLRRAAREAPPPAGRGNIVRFDGDCPGAGGINPPSRALEYATRRHHGV